MATVTASLFVVEGYEDEMHLAGHFRHHRLVFPQPYNFEVTFDAYTALHVRAARAAAADANRPGARAVAVAEEDVQRYHRHFLEDQRLQEERRGFRGELDQWLTDEEKYEATHTRARACYYGNRSAGTAPSRTQAMALWEACAALDTPRRKEAWYNLACCHADGGDAARALELLQQAVGAGFDDCETTLNDRSFQRLHDAPEFVECIRGMARLRPRRRPTMSHSLVRVGDKYERLSDVFCAQHNIPFDP